MADDDIKITELTTPARRLPSDIKLPAVFLMYSFRYALGRRSYAVADVADQLIAYRAILPADWRQQIVQDIHNAIENGNAGMNFDAERWREVARVMAE